MNFQESVKTCFTKYADFTGMASRPEYWWFALFCVVANFVISAVSPMLGVVFSLGTLVPGLAVGTRRLRETQRSGWWQLLWLVPVLGWIIIIIFLAQPATTTTTAATE